MMNIALGFDNKFAKYACVTIKSILYNNVAKIKFYLMVDSSVSFIYKKYMTHMIKSAGNEVVFIDMSKKFKNLFTTKAWSKAMYYPILLSSICEDERVLFLDSDVIVNSDLTEFYNTDLAGIQCAAVQDYGLLSVIKQNSDIAISNNSNKKVSTSEYFLQIRKWGSDDINRYFNSGVLLLNLSEMRKNNSEQKMLNILSCEKLAFPDQDCFNICFHDSVKILPMKYNFMVIIDEVLRNLDSEDKKCYLKIIKNNDIPPLIHFIKKPWKGLVSEIPFANLYYKYKNMTILRYLLEKSDRRNVIRLRISKNEVYLYLFGKRIFLIER